MEESLTKTKCLAEKRIRYLVVGHGRLATHLLHYLKILRLDGTHWYRKHPRAEEELSFHLAEGGITHVLLAISDSALEEFHRQKLSLYSGSVFHFSGAIEVPGVKGLHPLMSFGAELYPDEFYPQIPFVTISSGMDGPSLEKSSNDFLGRGFSFVGSFLPGFPNPLFKIPPDKKSLYHALCVIGGNFTTILLQKMICGLEELGLPRQSITPYIEQIIRNVFLNPDKALTGPLPRKDFITIKKNLASLEGDPFLSIYKSFISLVGIDLAEIENKPMI